jgi:hypothetical protein
MKGSERIALTAVFGLLLFGWLGFLIHRSPRFPGSGVGAVFGIAAAVLMLVPLVYVVVKRVPAIGKRVTKYVSMQTWLTIHVYAGILGPLLALIHTGHKFDSPLGVALTATMLLVVVTGFSLRVLLPYVASDMKDKLALLQTARGDLDNAWGLWGKAPAVTREALPRAPLLAAGLASLGLAHASDGTAGRVTTLAESVADLEYSIRTHEVLKRWFSRALWVHIVLSIALYALLAMHIWSGIYFGLRWLR